MAGSPYQKEGSHETALYSLQLDHQSLPKGMERQMGGQRVAAAGSVHFVLAPVVEMTQVLLQTWNLVLYAAAAPCSTETVAVRRSVSFAGHDQGSETSLAAAHSVAPQRS